MEINLSGAVDLSMKGFKLIFRRLAEGDTDRELLVFRHA
jgi:hypothetical protein